MPQPIFIRPILMIQATVCMLHGIMIGLIIYKLNLSQYFKRIKRNRAWTKQGDTKQEFQFQDCYEASLN